MEGVAKVGAGERHSKRETETGLVELVHRDDHERSGLGLLPASCWIGIGPVHVALMGLRLYHSGAGAWKPDSISSLSAR